MTDKQRIGNAIISIRQELGMTQSEMAEKCGFERSTLAKIEAGKYNASIDLLSRLLEPIHYRIQIERAVE